MSTDATEGTAQVVPIAADPDVRAVRTAVTALAKQAGLGVVEITKLVTACSELARNVLLHGGGGQASIAPAVDVRGRRGVRATFVDAGPGIPDVDLALRDGFTTGSGLGLGLGGAQRLVDEFTLDTRPGDGTTVVIAKWAAR